MRFLARLVLNGVAIIVAAWLLPGLHIDGPLPALVAGIILGFVNAIVRPVLFVLTFPLTLITLGIFIFFFFFCSDALLFFVCPPAVPRRFPPSTGSSGPSSARCWSAS